MCAGLTVPPSTLMSSSVQKHTHTHTRPCEEKAKMVTVTRECVPHVCSMPPLPRILLSMSQVGPVGFYLLHPAALMNCFLSFHGSVTHRPVVSTIFRIFQCWSSPGCGLCKKLASTRCVASWLEDTHVEAASKPITSCNSKCTKNTCSKLV